MNDEFARWAQSKYGALKPVKVQRGKVHEFLGMTLDFSVRGECHVRQDKHISEIISSWPKILKQSDKIALTPASKTLFEKGEGLLLSIDKKKYFIPPLPKDCSLRAAVGPIFLRQSASYHPECENLI